MRAERRRWTAAEDVLIRRLRSQGRGWAAIGRACGVTKYALRQHGVEDLGLPETEETARPERVLPDPRPPLPPGHPEAWGLLLALTPSLGNAVYCYQAPRIGRRVGERA
jgi:hypothetical protein